MAEQRQVTIYINAEERSSMLEEVSSTEFFNAIGYLSTWNMTYPSCFISKDGDTDMCAVYRNADNEIGYVIGAVWHGDHYGFHS
tara:strand:- start:46 stop:297 length:252 start_codon:yes stop_codon:yes gene_type:complete